ncbi:MAG: Crp/Fnr family transcriptional regulator [Deinococcales bacterium]
MAANRALQVLRHCPLFLGLSDSILRELAQVAISEYRLADSVLFLEGDEAKGLWIVETGAVKIYKMAPNGRREMILAIERKYQSVAELPILDGGTYPAHGSLFEDSQLWFISKAVLLEVFKRYPEILLHFLRVLGTRLRTLVNIIETLSFQQVLGRLAAYILEAGALGVPFALEKNAVIAAKLGTVHELITRNLSRLVQNNIVRLDIQGEKRIVVWFDQIALKNLVLGED